MASLPGVELDGDRIGTSTEALCYPEVPEHLVVIGAGYIGLELGSVWQRLGAKVTVLEYLDRILPGMDAEIAQGGPEDLREAGHRVPPGDARSRPRARDGDGCVVELEGQRADRAATACCSPSAASPNTDGLGLETVGIELDKRGRVPVDEHFAHHGPASTPSAT